MMGRKKEDSPLELPLSEEDHPLSGIAEELIHAVHAKDTAAVASALEAAFEVLESMPEDEGESES